MALPIDMQSLPAWLSQQRWFGGKGAAISGVRDLDRAQLSPGLLLSAVEVRYEPPNVPEDVTEARVREVFRDLTREDIRRYIGVRGEEYLYYRQRSPGWEPIFSFIAAVLRGLKRLESLSNL